MIERKLAEKFRRLYTENSIRLNDYDDQLFTLQDPFDWVQLLSERSYVMREIFAENEELMAELWENCSEEITPEEAELLYDLAIGFFYDGHHDFAVLTNFCERILPVFKEMEEPEFLVAIYHVLGYEYASFYSPLGDKKGMDIALDYFRESISLSDKYTKISTPEVREFIFEDYFNLISYLGNLYYKSDEKIIESIDLFEKMRTLWESEEAQNLDKDNQVIMRWLARTDDAFLAKTMHIEVMTPDEREKYSSLVKDMAARAYAEGGDEEGTPNYRICLTYRRIMREISNEEVLESLIKCINELIPLPDYNGDEHEALSLLMRHFKYACTAVMILRRMNLSGDKLDEWTDRFLPRSMEIMTNVPYHFLSGTMQPIFAEWYHSAEPVLRGELNKVRFLMYMIVRRQPFTYIHSQMVAKISTIIGKEMLDKSPGEFVGVRGIESEEDVKKNRAYLLSFINISGLVHDVGKCYIPDVVNRQNRSLNNTEFATIRKHPEIGYREAMGNVALKPYADVMIGHHKHYDGLHGYPLGYDNTKSPVRIIIDIISIADSVEAGTDTLSRSYTRGKDFSKLMKELEAEAGTRYNPRIVEVMKNSPELIEELTNLTGQGRYDVCYNAMQEILGNRKEDYNDMLKEYN